MSRPRLAVTLGDPRGIGPEIVAAARADARVRQAAALHVIGPRGVPGVDESVGEWSARDGTPAQAGRCAGLAVDIVLRGDHVRLDVAAVHDDGGGRLVARSLNAEDTDH